MKLSNKDVNDLRVVIENTLRNIGWGEGGSFITDDGNVDQKMKKSAERGIALIEKIISSSRDLRV